MNWALARTIPVKAFVQLWVVPGNGFLCLVSQQTGQARGDLRARDVIADTQGLLTKIHVTHGIFVHRDQATNPPDRLTLAPPSPR